MESEVRKELEAEKRKLQQELKRRGGESIKEFFKNQKSCQSELVPETANRGKNTRVGARNTLEKPKVKKGGERRQDAN